MSETDKTPDVCCVVVDGEKRLTVSAENKFIVISIDQAKDLNKALEFELALAEDS